MFLELLSEVVIEAAFGLGFKSIGNALAAKSPAEATRRRRWKERISLGILGLWFGLVLFFLIRSFVRE